MRNFPNLLSVVGACILFMITQAHAQQPKSEAAPSAEFLLSQLGEALRSQNYQGVFTFEYGGKLETFGIDHRVEDGVEKELLYRTTGSKSGFLRDGLLNCNTLGGNLINGQQLALSNGDHYAIKRNYQLRLAGQDRIAGRDAWAVQLLPKDEFRYGLSFAIDKQTNLLLRYVVFDVQKNTALERLQFATLVTDADTALLEDLERFGEPTYVQRVVSKQCVGERYNPSGHSPWKPTWLPPGFLLTGYSYSESEGHMETYTDGLTAFSIFVSESQSREGEARQAKQGLSSKGAITALLSLLPHEESMVSIAIVGDIPPSVAQRITLSLTRLQAVEESAGNDD